MTNDQTGRGSTRDGALDTLRGLVMVVMVLDHARDFWHGLRARPLDLATTTADLFLTRWVTHFCAPVFVALAGTSAYLYGMRRTPKERTHFLLTRGLFLIVLEITVIRLMWIPDPFYHFTVLQVIWVIGWSFVVLAGLSRAPLGLVAAFGALLVFGHNALDGVHAKSFGALAPVWNLLHERARLTPSPGHSVYVSYPLVPWVGVMALGFAFGPIVRLPFAERRALTWKLGATLTVGFVLLRALNGYGDPQPWKPQATPLFTLFSFINVEKYPPSLDYLLMTLGPALLLFAALPSTTPRFSPLATLGRVPLLFYVLHLFLLRYSSLVVAVLRFGTRAFQPPPHGTAASPELPLFVTYLAWIASLAVLYPVCRAYAKLKAERPRPWMGYL